jgi:tripartite-type tricarboxylate transporter receptor subunit TctC
VAELIALAQPKRRPAFPDIPTSREAGLPYWIVSTWYGLWGLEGAPQPIADRRQSRQCDT